MLKRGLIFFLFLMTIPVIYIKARDLSLAYYVFSSILIFPLFYLYVAKDRFLFTSCAVIYGAFQAYYLIWHFGLEMLILIALHIGLFLLLSFYNRLWQDRLTRENRKNDDLLKEWETLKHKHAHRLENLQHLEKQAASLMDLFEIARDFSECLSFSLLAELLHKKVRPELPFKILKLLLPPHGPGAATQSFYIDEKGNIAEDLSLTETEKKLMDTSPQEKRVQIEEDVWVFPLLIESGFRAHLIVQGAVQGDLAKFEVLVAHLVLQIKKIRLYDTVRALSTIDDLTQVFVRRHYLELFYDELKRSTKHGFSLALLMLDIDQFKRYNDDFGHLVGDATLKEVSAILRSNLRKVDLVARYGGEEFIMALPETHVAGALEVAERIRSNVARHIFKVYDVTTRVTASIGVAVFPADMVQVAAGRDNRALAEELINKCDQALYRAKDEGRNRVIHYQQL